MIDQTCLSPQQNSAVTQLCPGPDKPAKYFKEIFVSDTVKIPEQKPDKDQIVNVEKTIEFVDVQTVEITLPLEPGQTEPGVGNKIFVAGNIYLDVQYVSTRETQTVHFARFQLPFQTIILSDCGNLINPDDTIFGPDNSYVVHVCVEKINEEQLDERTINFEVLLLVWVEEVEAP